jgi:hypothetical protein
VQFVHLPLETRCTGSGVSEPETLVPLWKALSKRDDHDHLLWTDDYFAAFAQAASAELVTLDGVFRTRYPAVRVIDLLR